MTKDELIKQLEDAPGHAIVFFEEKLTGVMERARRVSFWSRAPNIKARERCQAHESMYVLITNDEGE